MTFYNFRRPHQTLSNQTPMAVWRDGMDKIEAAARAVDMPFRLDNASALPIHPQCKQREAAWFLEDKGRPDCTLNPTTRGPANGVRLGPRQPESPPRCLHHHLQLRQAPQIAALANPFPSHLRRLDQRPRTLHHQPAPPRFGTILTDLRPSGATSSSS
jgi:hypothetical protein